MDNETFDSLAVKLKKAMERVEGLANGIDTRILDLEQKGARRPGAALGGSLARKSYGGAVVESDGYKSLMASASQTGKFQIELKRSDLETKAIINPQITSGATSAGGLVAPDNQFGSIVEIARQALPIRALFDRTTTSSNLVIYPKQLQRSLNAGTAAEGVLKPQSDATFADVQVPIRTLAHWFRCSRQIMYDAPAFAGFINDEASYGIRLLEEMQMLYGDGTGQNLLGISPQATALAIPAAKASSAETALDVIALAMEQVVAAALPVDGLILNPVDWIELLRIKDGQGRYMSGAPFSTETISKIWNLNIATSLSVTPGTFFVGGFRGNVRIFDREEVSVVVSTEDQDNFVRNLVTVLAEERTALTVLRPAGIVTGPLYPAS